MMTIASRLKPFSHQPRTECLIPGSEFLVEAFPTLVRIKNYSGETLKEVPIKIEGSPKQFTVVQDLERGCVTVFSTEYRLHILPDLRVVFRKNPPLPAVSFEERLCLGSHKSQEWEAIKRRGNFCELFPLWFRLGSLLQLPARSGDNRGMFSLLEEIEKACSERRHETIVPTFERLFRAGFSNLLVPRASDEEHQGILPIDLPASNDSPLYLLTEGSRLIRSLFLQTEERTISILPHLPPQCFAGRALHFNCPPFGTIDFRWTKKTIMMVDFHATQDAGVMFRFPSQMKHFRLRTGENMIRCACTDVIEIRAGQHYLLDQFQK